MRVTGDIDAAAASAFLVEFLTDLHDLFFLITITGMRFQLNDTLVSVPVVWSGDATYGGSAGTAFSTAQYLDFIGRSDDGRRVRATVFGCTFSEQGENFRVTPAEQAAVGTAIATLNGDSDFFKAISGHGTIWKNYANCGQNAYWRNKIR
jgi:hypothetical protein